DSYEGQIDNPLSLNLYTYVHNNPLTNTDPSGHAPPRCQSSDTACIDDWRAENNQAIQNIEQLVEDAGNAYPPAGIAMEVAVAAKGAKGLWSSIKSGIRSLFTKGEDVIDTSKVWKMEATDRGKFIEQHLADTEYKDWFNIGQENNGYFPVIDFQKGNQVVSLKSLDPRSYSGNGATNKVIEYLDALNIGIKVNGQLANKILDIRVPSGTKGQFDIGKINDNLHDITLIIKEY
ncbi:hypothetical protein, partial [Paenibacillus sp. SI8]|uniref:hypothetical protein n=1 Tax=unclassified Paenibacillus TaxID=185978 RepID=UPI003465FFFC